MLAAMSTIGMVPPVRAFGHGPIRLRGPSSSALQNLLEVYDGNAALRAIITSAGAFSNSQGKASSEAFGSGASVTSTSCTAVGNGASASNDQNTALGVSATASGASRSAAFGASASASGNRSVAFGANSIASGEGAIAIGNSCAAGGISVIGNVSIGYNAGSISNTLGPYVAIGYGAGPTANNQGLLGGASGPITDWYLGKGVTHATPPASVTVQPTGGSGTDIAGAPLIVAGGKGTGNAAGGNVKIQTSTAGASGTTLQTLATVAEFGPGTLGFYGVTPVARDTGWTTFTNLSTDRTCDANATTVDELADILGTLIEKLKATGIIGA